MAGSSKEVKRRIKSAKNIKQITKAMETVAATKMRKAQEAAISGREYAESAFLLLQNLATRVDVEAHPLLQKNEKAKKQLVVVIGTDKGLVGGLNTNLFRRVKSLNDDLVAKGHAVDYITVGRRAEMFAKRHNWNLLEGAGRAGVGDGVNQKDARDLATLIVEKYLEGEYQKVILAYTNFVSTLSQKPFVRGILPLTQEKIEDLGDLTDAEAKKIAKSREGEGRVVDYIFEPSKYDVLNELVPRLIEALIYHDFLEAIASEHSARMIAMKNASENADELIGDLTLSYNRLRQEGITKEIAEISAGANSQQE